MSKNKHNRTYYTSQESFLDLEEALVSCLYVKRTIADVKKYDALMGLKNKMKYYKISIEEVPEPNEIETVSKG